MTRRSLILDVTVRTIFDSAVVLSLYLLFTGHNQPGGGFVGGLVAGSALGLCFVAGGPGAVDRALRVRPGAILAIGLLLAAGTAAAPLLVGDPVLAQPLASVDLPFFGTVSATGALPFDVGVYGVVVGMIGLVLDAVGRDANADATPEDAEATR